jgi:hypothetical protein
MFQKGLSAHHQESETVRTASDTCHTGYMVASSHRTTIEMLASIIPAECNGQKYSVPLRTNILSPTASLPAVTECCLKTLERRRITCVYGVTFRADGSRYRPVRTMLERHLGLLSSGMCHLVVR